MGEVYTFTKFPQAYCHLCHQHYKNIFAHTRGKEHKRRYKDYLAGRKPLLTYYTKKDLMSFVSENK